MLNKFEFDFREKIAYFEYMQTFIDRLIRSIFPQKDADLVKKKYGLPEKLNLKIQMINDGSFVITSDDLPGLVTEAQNKDELIEMVNDAVLTYFNVPRRESDIVYNELRVGNEVMRYNAELVTKHA